ncbi:hypothetical protein KP509_34G017100 [Ceratopteris richardii]|uniref:Uncharacterized protein n=1 Tax=Ceratopteris richardii TaxID=49495 RepID=A0A8T2QJ39_CERRI|nr:hypothetical protein KP509_34G017100 [Ceratopteris richardii]
MLPKEHQGKICEASKTSFCPIRLVPSGSQKPQPPLTSAQRSSPRPICITSPWLTSHTSQRSSKNIRSIILPLPRRSPHTPICITSPWLTSHTSQRSSKNIQSIILPHHTISHHGGTYYRNPHHLIHTVQYYNQYQTS